MHWKEIVKKAAGRSGGSAEEMERFLNAFFDTVIEELNQSDSVELREDFGSFQVRERGGEAPSEHRNSYTKVHRTAVFKASNELKKKLRQTDEEFLRMLEDKGAKKQVENLRRAAEKQIPAS